MMVLTLGVVVLHVSVVVVEVLGVSVTVGGLDASGVNSYIKTVVELDVGGVRSVVESQHRMLH